MPEPIRRGLRLGWSLLALGILLAALWRVSSQVFGWLRRRLGGRAGAEVEGLPGAFRADLLAWLKGILLRLLRLRRPFPAGGKWGASPPGAGVRQVYRQLLRWAAAAGQPRQESQTPYEYLHTLAGLLPEARGDLELITRQYVMARYSPSLPGERELDELRQSWHRIKQNRLKRPGANGLKDRG